MQHNAQDVERDSDHENVLEMAQVAVAAQEEQQVLVLRKIAAVLPLHLRLHKVAMVVDQEHRRRHVEAHVPEEQGRRAALHRNTFGGAQQ